MILSHITQMEHPMTKIKKHELGVGDERAMKKMMTIQEAYDGGYLQMYLILESDRRIRKALGMASLQEAIHNPPKRDGRGRPKKL